MDEVPIPFEYLDGYTYNQKGAKTVSVKTDRSGWSKRQATLILYIFADGKGYLKPKIIFHAAVDGKVANSEEVAKYDPRVTITFNPTAYNEDLMIQWIKEELTTVLTPESDNLLVMDVARFHYTPDIKIQLKAGNILTAMIPGGLTGHLQPLDTHINAYFKRLLRDITERLVAEKEKHEPMEKWSVSDRRIMTTWAVGEAWEQILADPQRVVKAFKECGISVAPDGSEDDLIRIKDMAPEQRVLDGWEQADDIDNVKIEPWHEIHGYDLDDDTVYGINPHDKFKEYSLLTKTQLIVICKDKGYTCTGTKAQLLDRLMHLEMYYLEEAAGSRLDPVLIEAEEEVIQGPGSEAVSEPDAVSTSFSSTASTLVATDSSSASFFNTVLM
jgi:hypothetical protein